MDRSEALDTLAPAFDYEEVFVDGVNFQAAFDLRGEPYGLYVRGADVTQVVTEDVADRVWAEAQEQRAANYEEHRADTLAEMRRAA